MYVSSMRRVVRLACAPLALFVFLSNTAVAEAATKVKIQVGTAVDLAFNEALTGETATLGQSVVLHVTTPVVVDGHTVIAAGAPAAAEVTTAHKAGMIGIPGTLTVVAKNVTAVDGSVIAISRTKAMEGKSNIAPSVIITVVCCILGLLMKGGKAEIPSGSSMRASTATVAEVTAE